MKKIDLENHFYDACVREALIERTTPPYFSEEENTLYWTETINMPPGFVYPLLLEVADKRKEEMEANGVTTAVLSSSPGPEQLEIKKSIEVCQKSNETIYEVTKKYPGLYLGSAVLPVNDTEAACKELEKCVKEYGFVAWQAHSNFGDTAPDEERYWPIFQKAAELGIYVYLHPQVPDDRRTRNCGFMVAAPMLGFTQDTMTTVTKLMLSGMLDEIPDTKLVLGHLGEAIPFLLARMDNGVQVELNPFVRAQHPLRYYFEHNIMVTTSGNMSPEAFECTKSVLGIDRICFASDYPYANMAKVKEFHDELSLTQKEREKLFYQNAEEMLGIPL